MANYNSYFPQTYSGTPYAYGAGATQPQTWAPQAPAQPQPGAITWVQGEAGARSIPIAAGQKAILMDSETNVFYVKSSDPSGMPLPLRIFEYKEVNKVAAGAHAEETSTYITREEFEKAIAELKEGVKEEKKSNEFII